VQDEVSSRLARIDDGNLRELADIDGFRGDFLRVHGFEVPVVDYSAEVDPLA
jgi:enoyl-[acyl-carrier protein] reductase/trans-2-enoyl-CoA reductase (NAD+)